MRDETKRKLTRPLLVFSNLNVAAFDDNGDQIPALQKSIPQLMAEHLEKEGYDPQGVVIETWFSKWKLFRTEDGNWNRDQC